MNKIIIALVVVVVLAGGVFFIMKKKSSEVKTGDENTAGTNPAPTTASGFGSEEVERLMKAAPGANATQEEIIAYFDEVSKVAVASDFVDLENCVAKPAIVKVKAGYDVLFRNVDPKEHTITHPLWTVKVSAMGEAKLKATGGGVQGYVCDNMPVGILFVTP